MIGWDWCLHCRHPDPKDKCITTCAIRATTHAMKTVSPIEKHKLPPLATCGLAFTGIASILTDCTNIYLVKYVNNRLVHLPVSHLSGIEVLFTKIWVLLQLSSPAAMLSCHFQHSTAATPESIVRPWLHRVFDRISCRCHERYPLIHHVGTIYRSSITIP